MSVSPNLLPLALEINQSINQSIFCLTNISVQIFSSCQKSAEALPGCNLHCQDLWSGSARGNKVNNGYCSQMDSLWIYIFCVGGYFLSLMQNNPQPPSPAQKNPKPQTPPLDPNGPYESYMEKLFFLPQGSYSPFHCQKVELGLFWLHGRHLGKLLITCVKYSYHAHSWSLGILSKTCLPIDCCFDESVQQLFLSFPLWNGNCKRNHSYPK